MVRTRSQKSDMEETNCQPELHLITGGGGFAGFWLGKRLAGHGHRVMLVDVREPIWTMKENMEFFQCDLTDKASISALFAGVDCVYHMASYGMSGREQLNRKRIEAVNVDGTGNVIKGCIANDITRLIYTSTYNTIFGGQTIKDGNETLPYLPLDKHPDHYSRTKSIAEQKVLASDGMTTKGGETLHTCTLRLAAVYGPGETRHIPRIVDNIEQGLFFIIYQRESLQDFLHVENLSQAHELAGQGLKHDKGYVAAGQAYFVSDDAPVNTFTFFQPLIVGLGDILVILAHLSRRLKDRGSRLYTCVFSSPEHQVLKIEGLGYPMPSITIPLSVIYFIAFLTEWLHYLVSPVYNFQPLLTRTEVYKTGVTHYFSIKKAREQLGYHPTIQNDLSKVVQHYINCGHKRQEVYKTGVTHYFSIKKAREQLGYHPTIQNDLSKVVQHYINCGHKRQEVKSQSGLLYWIVNFFFMCIIGMLILSYLPTVK